MAHTGVKRWRDGMYTPPTGVAGIDEAVQNQISNVARSARDALIQGEEAYQQLVELYTYAGSTVQGLADQLFKEDWETRSEMQANAAEVAIAQDAFDAMTALHELYQAATNQTVAAEDRLAQLRRMI